MYGSIPSLHPKQKFHDETKTKVKWQYLERRRDAFVGSHMYAWVVTNDPEVFESLTFLQSREETMQRRFVPPRVTQFLQLIASFHSKTIRNNDTKIM